MISLWINYKHICVFVYDACVFSYRKVESRPMPCVEGILEQGSASGLELTPDCPTLVFLFSFWFMGDWDTSFGTSLVWKFWKMFQNGRHKWHETIVEDLYVESNTLLGLWRPSWWRLHCSLCYFILLLFYWRLRGVIILTSCWKGVVQEPTIQPLPRLVKAGAKMGSNEEVCALKVWCLRFCCSWASEKEVKFMLWLHRTH